MIKNVNPAAQLKELICDAVDNDNFNYIKDLKNLQKSFKKFKAKDFNKLIEMIIKKYESAEAIEAAHIRSALVRKARAGDTKAIELYRDMQKDNNIGDEVQIIDDLG